MGILINFMEVVQSSNKREFEFGCNSRGAISINLA